MGQANLINTFQQSRPQCFMNFNGSINNFAGYSVNAFDRFCSSPYIHSVLSVTSVVKEVLIKPLHEPHLIRQGDVVGEISCHGVQFEEKPAVVEVKADSRVGPMVRAPGARAPEQIGRAS